MNTPILLDGGMGRELKRSGAPFRRPEWSALALMEGPEHVSRAHQAFVDAGAQVITTNAYAVVPYHIGDERFAADGARLAALAAELARGVADQHNQSNDASSRSVQVAGCLPPAFGSYRPDLFDGEQAPEIYKVLIESQAAHVDFWLAETLSCVEEARVIAEQVAVLAPKPLWLSFTLSDDPVAEGETPTLRSGQTVEQALETALAAGAEALLFNCSQMERMAPALQTLKALAPALRIGVYANNFEPIEASVKVAETGVEMRDDVAPEIYGQVALEWIALGASIVGGCCGIGPEHIQGVRKAIDGM